MDELLKSAAVQDISAMPGGTTFMNNCWWFGYRPGLEHVGWTPNYASICRVLVHGSVRFVLFEFSTLQTAMAELGQDLPDDKIMLMETLGKLDHKKILELHGVGADIMLGTFEANQTRAMRLGLCRDSVQ